MTKDLRKKLNVKWTSVYYLFESFIDSLENATKKDF